MDENSHVGKNESTDESQRAESAIGAPPGHPCSLTPEQAERRREWSKANLRPHLVTIEEHDNGFSLVFERTAEAYAAVTEAAWKESQCCSWATFEVELPPNDDPIEWHECSDRASETAFFGDALREVL